MSMSVANAGGRTRLARVMWERRETYETVVPRSGVSRQALADALHGRPVKIDTWIKLAEALGVTVSEIAPDEDAARIAAVV